MKSSALARAITRSSARRRFGAIIITADTDFGGLLVQSGRTEQSVILVRELLSLPVASQGRLLAANLDQIREVLITGAIFVLLTG